MQLSVDDYLKVEMLDEELEDFLKSEALELQALNYMERSEQINSEEVKAVKAVYPLAKKV